VHEILVPKLNSNDATYTLVEWLLQDGEEARAGQPVAVIETSKAAEDLVAPSSGLLHRTAEVHTECRFGDAIGYIFPAEQDRLEFLDSHETDGAGGEPAEGDILITEPARELIHQRGIGHGQLLALGKKIILRTDVENLIRGGAQAQTPAGVMHTLPRRQWAVADVVTHSHRQTPTAFSVIKISAVATSDLRRRLADQGQPVVGLPELMIRATAGLRERHPLFFGSYRDDDHTVLVPEGAHVAVTVDAGSGLYTPVIRDADRKKVAQIGAILREFQVKAAHGSFKELDLAHGNIGLSLNMYTGVILTHPIVLPSHTCMLSLSGIEREIVLEKSGAPGTRPYFHLGIAYDHRVVNGRDTMLFLRDIKITFETAERLDALLV
jgi:2-oxoglutarate dehydrogenase E2 component (dihydrolipoamide succinyltransferase)